MLGKKKEEDNLRTKKLARNTMSSMIYQVMTIGCGFILPRLMLSCYGSEVNGIVNSITQFLQIVAFLDLGVGAVVQSSLYKPLANNDTQQISRVVKSATRFFRNLAKILLVYVVGLILVYPYLANQQFGFGYTAALIIAMSISSFAQYYFGIVNRLLLLADQRGYIQYDIQTITLILNTIACAVLMRWNVSIQLVKLTTSLIYLLRPIGLNCYVKKNYKIDMDITYVDEPIKQKWNGVAQHIAAVILDGTDSIVLTIFSTLSSVSIYSVYNLVAFGVKQLFVSMTNGIQSLMGELWAKEEINELESFFDWVEWTIHTGVVYVFGCTSALIVPFISVYTKGITDANYIQPVFGVILVVANAVCCLRIPYILMILASGSYKQTQNNYIIAAILNIGLSILLVRKFGLIGVSIGTLASMVYQTVWTALYNEKHLIKRSISFFIKQVFVDFCGAFVIFVLNKLLGQYISTNYLEWCWYAVKVALVFLVFEVAINYVFYKEKMKKLTGKILLVSKKIGMKVF